MTTRSEAKEMEWRRKTKPVRLAHAWMTVRARQVVDLDLSNEEIMTLVNYVYEQTLAHVFEVLKHHGRKRTLALDIILLESIIILGHGPDKDPTPMPESWAKHDPRKAN